MLHASCYVITHTLLYASRMIYMHVKTLNKISLAGKLFFLSLPINLHYTSHTHIYLVMTSEGGEMRLTSCISWGFLCAS